MRFETKIGLLVGMAIILVIGIVISDQLSVANQQNPPALTGFAEGSQRNLVHTHLPLTAPAGNRQAIQPRQPVGASQGDPRHTGRTTHSPSQGQPAVADPSNTNVHRQAPILAPGELRENPDRKMVDRDQPLKALKKDTKPLEGRTQAKRPLQGPQPNTGSSEALAILREELRRRERERLANAGGSENGTGDSTGNGGRLQPIIHYVKDNESLWHIAQRYYGNGGYWRRIAAANPGKVGKNGSVRKGVRLEIPHQRAAVRTVDDTTAKRASDQVAAGNNKPASTQTVAYVVRKNDTLWSIAAKKLGSGAKHGDILALNRSVLRGKADNLRPGMNLKLPKK